MKYFKGDIVEIITAQYKSYNDIPMHERGFIDNSNCGVAPVIGMRFRVDIVGDLFLSSDMNLKPCIGAKIHCVFLYKRPIINCIKNLFI